MQTGDDEEAKDADKDDKGEEEEEEEEEEDEAAEDRDADHDNCDDGHNHKDEFRSWALNVLGISIESSISGLWNPLPRMLQISWSYYILPRIACMGRAIKASSMKIGLLETSRDCSGAMVRP